MAAKASSAKRASHTKALLRSAHNKVGTAVDKHNQHAAHGGRARFFLVILRAFFSDVLANLQLAQLADQPRTEHESEKHAGEASVHGAHGDVAKHVERAEIFLQRVIEEVVKHLVPRLFTGSLRLAGRSGRATRRRCVPFLRRANL